MPRSQHPEPTAPMIERFERFTSGLSRKKRNKIDAALKEVAKLGPCAGWRRGRSRDDDVWMLYYLALEAICYAREWHKSHEPDEERWRTERKTLKRELNAVVEARSAIERILGDEGAHLAGWLSLADLVAVRQGLQNIERAIESLPMQPTENRIMCMAWIGRARYQAKPVQRSTALAFNLTHFFRQYTGAGRQMGYAIPMPKVGRPCTSIACEITATALGGNPAKIREALNFQLRSKPRLISWPQRQQ